MKGDVMNVISNARKLIFRPEQGAAVVEFPEDAKVNDWGTNNKSPSVVVRNGTEAEPSWQGVDHDSGVVILNEVPSEVADMALLAFELGGKSNHGLNRVLETLERLGFVDQYTTNLTFVEGKLSSAGTMLDQYTGIVKRDDRDLTPCWREDGKFWTAPSGKARVIEPDILKRTYRNADGSEIDLDTVPEGRPEGVEA